MKRKMMTAKIAMMMERRRRKKEKEDEFDYIRPSKEAMIEYEAAWDEILSDEDAIPYNLRVLPYRHYSFYSSKSVPEIVPIDDELFVKMSKNKDIDIIVEWKADSYEKIKGVVNKVVVDAEYSKWKKDKP